MDIGKATNKNNQYRMYITSIYNLRVTGQIYSIPVLYRIKNLMYWQFQQRVSPITNNTRFNLGIWI